MLGTTRPLNSKTRSNLNWSLGVRGLGVLVAIVTASGVGVLGASPGTFNANARHSLKTQSALPHIVLLFDNSSSQSGILFAPAGPDKILLGRTTTTTREKLVAVLARSLPPGARLRIASFGSRVVVSPDWVRSASEIAAAFDAVEQPLGAPSPVWDGVWQTAAALDGASGHKVLVVITDGRASANIRGFEEAAERVVTGDIQVHSVVTIDRKLAAQIDNDADPSAALRVLATRTGGTVAHKNPAELPDYVGTLVRKFGR